MSQLNHSRNNKHVGKKVNVGRFQKSGNKDNKKCNLKRAHAKRGFVDLCYDKQNQNFPSSTDYNYSESEDVGYTSQIGISTMNESEILNAACEDVSTSYVGRYAGRVWSSIKTPYHAFMYAYDRFDGEYVRDPSLLFSLRRQPFSFKWVNEDHESHQYNPRYIEKTSRKVAFAEAGTVRNFLNDLSKVYNASVPYKQLRLCEETICRIEDAVSLYFALVDCNTVQQFSGIAALYARNWCKGSLTINVAEYICDLFGYSSQFGEVGEESRGAMPTDWMDMIRKLRTNWSYVKNNMFFQHLSKILGLFVFLGLANSSDLTFDIKGYQVCAPDLELLHKSSFDIFDACFQTVTYFAETFSACVKNKSLRPLFFDNPDLITLDDEYAQILSQWAQYQLGNLEVHSVSEEKFHQNLESLCQKIKNLVQSTKGSENSILSAKYCKLVSILHAYTSAKIHSGIRGAPFVIELFGPSSQGKTTIGKQIVDFLLSSQGQSLDNKYRASYNPGDKYMSSWKSDMTVLTIDDFANDKVAGPVPPTRVIIDVCNNNPYYANKAEVEAKGKVVVAPKIVIVNTNIKNLNAGLHSHCPYSVQRRMHCVISVNANKDYQAEIGGVESTLDGDKVSAHRKALGDKYAFDDCWDLTLEQAYAPPRIDKVANYVPITKVCVDAHGNKYTERYVNVGFKKAINYLIDEYANHLRRQHEVVYNTINPPKQVPCPWRGCNQFVSTCIQHIGQPPAHLLKDCQPVVLIQPACVPSVCQPITPIIKNDRLPVVSECFHGQFSDADDSSCPSAVEVDDDDDPFLQLDACDDDHQSDVPEYVCGLDGVPHKFNGDKLAFSEWLMQEKRRQKEEDKFHAYSRKMDNQFGDYLASKIVHVGQSCVTRFSKSADTFESNLGNALVLGATSWLKTWDWMKFVPSSWVLHDNAMAALYASNYAELNSRYTRWSLFSWCRLFCGSVGVVAVFPLVPAAPVFLCATGFGIVKQLKMHNTVYQHFKREVIQRNTITPTLAIIRDQYLDKAFKAGGLLSTLLVLHKAYKLVMHAQLSQGSLAPSCVRDVEERDAERNVWSPVVRRSLPDNSYTKTSVLSHVITKIKKNLVCCTTVQDDKRLTTNGLFITSNVILLPAHALLKGKDDIRYMCGKENPDCNGGKFEIQVSAANRYKIPNTDTMLCYVASGGSFADITHLFVDDNFDDAEFQMLWRGGTGDMLTANGQCVRGIALHTPHAHNSDGSFDGYNYKLNINTFDGLCGGVLVSTKSLSILGIHLGGYGGQPLGCAGSIFKKNLLSGIQDLRTRIGVVVTGKAGKFETQVLGVKLDFEQDLHVKSPINYLPVDSSIEYLGSDNRLSRFRSSVRKTVISDSIHKVTGVPNSYCAPDVKQRWAPWQDCMANMSHPGRPFPSTTFNLAVEDYKRDLIDKVFSKYMWRSIAPLGDLENVSGVPGKRFLDAIKASTSMGYPVNKKKSNYMIDLEPTDVYQNPRTFTPEVWDEITRCEDLYKVGMRAYPIAKGCLKDEVKSVAKPKCRVFYVNAIALTFLLRKYFLPIMRVLQMNSLLSECAVGINCHGPEWHQLHDHIRTFGEDRVIGGDYSKYDQRLPSQVLLGSLHCLISFAKCCDYEPQDIRVMEAMVADVVYPMICMNGDLISLTEGSHISGNSLTTVLNGICGSLNMRCAFFDANPPKVFGGIMNFRDHVKLMTYGDDNVGSVSEESNLNIIVISKYLERYGQIYTMPDKNSELRAFLNKNEIEFLKRKSVYHDDLRCYIGALSESSCFKMLHAHLWERDSPNTQDRAAAINIDTALLEWFNHGEQLYEKRREEMKQVAAACNLTTYCQTLDLSYKDRVGQWFELYFPNMDPDMSLK